MSMSIRPAVLSDAPALAALAEATFVLACPLGTSEEDLEAHLERHLAVDSFERYLADPGHQVIVAELEGTAGGSPLGARLLGYTMLVDGPHDEEIVVQLGAAPSIELSKFYVLQEHHGVGVSAGLMEATLAAAVARGAAGLWLGVNEHNARAQRFYGKHGFAAVGRKTFLLGTSPQRDHVMELVLS
jgi:GNAT superfamily N-acetyltransferase